ncbi:MULTISPECIES: hypothetical protein [unclassified Mycobacterium]|uniref:hypothetical protein n=1 Tax=unclassified Mycobacterium TaxID=2642494 RepID=UPI0029C6B95F|nr:MULTISPECIES: hypothetical protein [unclassified Mycobacterium]
MDVKLDPPLAEAKMTPIVRDHLDRFGQVLQVAWKDFQGLRQLAGSSLARASAGTRAMLVTDFVRAPAHQLFAGVDGVSVEDRYGRPWVSLHGGRVQVRFKRLTASLRLCPTDTERQVRLAYHLGDPCLPGMPEATILTAGYVVDAGATALAGTYLVCHVGDEPYYSIALPRSAPIACQLPLLPLSAPVIRSTRTAVRKRLDRESGA